MDMSLPHRHTLQGLQQIASGADPDAVASRLVDNANDHSVETSSASVWHEYREGSENPAKATIPQILRREINEKQGQFAVGKTGPSKNDDFDLEHGLMQSKVDRKWQAKANARPQPQSWSTWSIKLDGGGHFEWSFATSGWPGKILTMSEDNVNLLKGVLNSMLTEAP
ncbi:hypothetical protein OEA41_002716 [Lepraria neglecta]|uniref:Uncharacterized protein n=1 Tax=Lepraria neglecta TaxID=209136 RepID=A0AAE0DIP6_9LECA|nr:hypothetical protein OEA41_002716 [Lepraria neglecta]